jgi:Fic family protein
LPPPWKLPESLWPLLAESKQRLGLLQGLGLATPIDLNPTILLPQLLRREAIYSSAIEGTYASAEQLLLFELEPKTPQSERDPVNDHLEVDNYRKALQHGIESELPLCWRLVRELHEILLTNVRGRDRAPGQFRTIPVGIGGARFIPPPPTMLEEPLRDLEQYMNRERSEFDPLIDSFLVHYQFEAIHPFMDGNGRVGRLLLALMLQRKCGLTKPWLYMSSYFGAHRSAYMRHLFDISTKANWLGWIEFCLRGVIVQANDTVARFERILRLRNEYMNRLLAIDGSTRLNSIVDSLFETPYVRITDLARKLNIHYQTAQGDLERLQLANILVELPDMRPKTYHAPEVLDVAYEQLR